mmetsp:Transcript_24977/g.56639  ORF Transcript_24977/g.56639 Transcript_24977/m.56639 type:complete len:158 (-) Transcript_24977:61-534(-)|eukprot:CAMPEP_0197898134 /NCGR_PEP_ID=MMETSP1439-20131203/43327_1 /TAXON_ID=66791 /ORGANISM="Gonyaulax spinifera, Strain CCMP409" /LENGTH=157 /DNA_ID=CAMNT_0043518827 /DNA_START=43 /DNA_END=516 /DNA_ORIENTATION=+
MASRSSALAAALLCCLALGLLQATGFVPACGAPPAGLASAPSGGAPLALGAATAQPSAGACSGGWRFAVGVAAFAAVALQGRLASTTRKAEKDGKINTQIDPESPKVVNKEDLVAGDKKVYCRCWKSKTFPLCDGAHAKHNEETGDNVGPLIVSVEK